jgi:outer membrane protein, heavy metal efflux system
VKKCLILLMFGIFAIALLHAEDVLTLETILNRIQDNNLELKSMKKQIDAAQSGIVQAGLFSNPELEVELGNFGKDEIGVGLGQTFELGGKRKNRKDIAKSELMKTELELEMKKRELEISAIRGILPLLSASEKLILLDSAIAIGQTTTETIRKRVEAGSTMSIDLMRAEMDLEGLFLERRSADKELSQLHKNLPASWSESVVDFEKVSGKINDQINIPSLEILREALTEHPEVQMIELERKQSRLELKEAKISAIPDLSLGVGVTREMETEENSIGLTAGIELPIFNRHQGYIKAKEHSNAALQYEADNTILSKEAELLELYNQLSIITDELNTAKTKILPKAETVFQTLLDYYERGSISLLDVKEAQAELLECNTGIIENLAARAELLLDLYELTGYKMNIIISE